MVNQEDGMKYSHGSNKYVDCKCPNCGFEKQVMVSNLCRKGFKCPICSDGISYPEKFILHLLQEKSVNFIFQLSRKHFSWCEQYRYDFYLVDYEAIIEVHGSQHYNTPFRFKEANTLSNTKTNDNIKMKLAIANGIYKEKYIVIDGRNKDKDWMVNSILNSKLAELINLDDVNWEEIDKKCHGSILIDICSYYDKHHPITTIEIANNFNISRDSVVRYLNIGYKYGFCSYNSKQSRIEAGGKGNMIVKKLLSRKVDVYKDGVFIKSYDSAKELYRNSMLDYGIQFGYASICEVCRGVTKKHHGYVFKYRKEDEK